MSRSTIRINRVHYPVTALGPGTRVGIWLQGCDLGCHGCISRDTWAPGAGRDLSVSEMVDALDGLVDGPLDGVTISGGEPFGQPRGLADLLVGIRVWAGERWGSRAIDVLCYSGHPIELLEASHPDLLGLLDVIVSDPYVAAIPSPDGLRGSGNQRITPLSPLGEERYGAAAPRVPRRLQTEVDEGGSVWLIGIPGRGDLRRLTRRLAASGVHLEGVSWQA